MDIKMYGSKEKWMGGRKDTRIDKKILMVGGWWMVGGQKKRMVGWIVKIDGWLDVL